MIRAAFVAGTYQPQYCGVAHYTAHLREALKKQGVDSVVLTTHAAANTVDDSSVQGAVKRWHLTQLISLIRAIHRSQVDCLHIQHAAGTYGFDRAIFLLPLLLRLSGWRLPIITTVHEYGWWEWQPAQVPPKLLEWVKTRGQQQGWWDREDGFLLTQSDAIITTNADAKRIIHQRLPHLKPLVHRIPIAANVETELVDRATARKMVQQVCGWSEQNKIIAFFSFLHPVKGLETLLSAFKQVVAVHPQARLLLIGGVESLALPAEQANRYWNQLQSQIAELGLTNVVHMTGYLSTQVSDYLTAADIGVLPFNAGVTCKSGSLLAMMAHGLPIVATRANPPDPELTNDALLKLTTPRNASALATALMDLLTDPAQQHRLSKAALDYSQRFTWPTIAAAHLDVYNRVC